MELFTVSKDGGPESTVTAYWLVEIKSLFSIVLLKFDGKSREAYHNHAFNSVSWLLKGKLFEEMFGGMYDFFVHTPRLKPIITKKETFHKVDSDGTSYVLSFRGPWKKDWLEYLPNERLYKHLTHGRVEV